MRSTLLKGIALDLDELMDARETTYLEQEALPSMTQREILLDKIADTKRQHNEELA